MARINSEEVIWNEVDGDVVALAASSGAYFVLNGAASHIWKLLDQGKSNADIVKELTKLYGVPVATLESDVNAFITQAVSKGLLSA
jgi:hypothetical protein